jgi:hypothetical protein
VIRPSLKTLTHRMLFVGALSLPAGWATAVGDATGQRLGFFYGRADPQSARLAGVLSLDEARRMAVDADPQTADHLLGQAQVQSQTGAVVPLLIRLEKTKPAIAPSEPASFASTPRPTPPSVPDHVPEASFSLASATAPVADNRATNERPTDGRTPVPATPAIAPATGRTEPATVAVGEDLVLAAATTQTDDLRPAAGKPAPAKYGPAVQDITGRVDIKPEEAKPKVPSKRHPSRMTDETLGVSASDIRRALARYPEIRAALRAYGL